jgi:hypothetical protein
MDYTRWTKNGQDRLYIKAATGFKNRPYENIGSIDLNSGEVIPAKGQHHGSVEAYVQRDGKTVAALVAEYRAQAAVEAPTKDIVTEELRELGYNAGAASYVAKAIRAEHLTMQQAINGAARNLAAINEQYGK